MSARFLTAFLVLTALFVPAGDANADLVLLNEYNAVGSSKFLDGGGVSDATFGEIQGNGGNWIELLVVGQSGMSTVDMRGWQLNWMEGATAGTITLSQDSFWETVQRGTLITIIETTDAGGAGINTSTDLSFDGVNDWHVNISSQQEQAQADSAQNYLMTTTTNDGLAGDFSVGNDDWELSILDSNGTVISGPIGEGIANNWGGGGLNSEEVGKLEAFAAGATLSDWFNSDGLIYENNMKDGTSSTFGQANMWSSGSITQDFSALRAVPEPSSTAALFGLAAVLLVRRRNK